MKCNKSILLAGLIPLLVAGCATNQSATYVDSKGPRTLVTADQINIQDFANAADEMVNSLIENWINAGKLKSSTPNDSAILAISRIVNGTAQHLDTDMLIKKIRVSLNRTGKVETLMTLSKEDPMAADLAMEQEVLLKKRPAGPDYTLSGKILQTQTRSGNTRQMAYTFQLSLTSSRGTAIWEEEKTIVKQDKKPAASW